MILSNEEKRQKNGVKSIILACFKGSKISWGWWKQRKAWKATQIDEKKQKKAKDKQSMEVSARIQILEITTIKNKVEIEG